MSVINFARGKEKSIVERKFLSLSSDLFLPTKPKGGGDLDLVGVS